jgi:uncharacterized protein YraI
MRDRRFWPVILILMLISGVVSAEPQQQTSDLLATLTGRANLRTGPGTDWILVGTYDAGTPIRLDGRAPGGGWVRGIVPDGKVGWMLDTGLSITPEQAASLRPIWVEEPFTLPAPEGGPVPNNAPAPPPENAPEQAPAAPQPVVIEGGIATTTAARVNMRSNPGQSVIKTVDYNVPIVANGRNAESDWVRGALADGTVGWIYFTYLALPPGDIAKLPVVEGGAVVAAALEAAAAPESAAAPAAPLVNYALFIGL